MAVHLHFHDKIDRTGSDQIQARVDALIARLDGLTLDIRALKAQGDSLMAVAQAIQDKLDSLAAAVAANTTVGSSVITLLQGLTAMIAALRQQLADAIAANDPAAVQAVLDALTGLETSVTKDTDDLAAAAVENTPATP